MAKITAATIGRARKGRVSRGGRKISAVWVRSTPLGPVSSTMITVMTTPMRTGGRRPSGQSTSRRRPSSTGSISTCRTTARAPRRPPVHACPALPARRGRVGPDGSETQRESSRAGLAGSLPNDQRVGAQPALPKRCENQPVPCSVRPRPHRRRSSVDWSPRRPATPSGRARR